MGSENLSKPTIRKMIGNALDKTLKAEEVLQNLSQIANSEAEFKGSDVVKANELIGKYHKLFVDRVESETTHNVNIQLSMASFTDELEKLMDDEPKLIGSGPAIDVSPEKP